MNTIKKGVKAVNIDKIEDLMTSIVADARVVDILLTDIENSARDSEVAYRVYAGHTMIKDLFRAASELNRQLEIE